MDAYDELREPGDRNPGLEAVLDDQQDRPYAIDTGQEGTCEPCRIPLYPFSAGESVYWQDDEGYVVETATKKGHEVRNMAVHREHGTVPEQDQLEELYDRLLEITAGQVGDGEVIVFGSMQTFPDHVHLCASDLEGDDLEDIHDYHRYAVKDGDAELVESRVRSEMGKLLLPR